MNYNDTSRNIYNIRYNQQKFLEHAPFAEHYARMKIVNASNHNLYYRYAELEYFHRSKANHYKGLFSAESTLTQYY